ncbi:hypothetical protein VP01_3001g1 [Puccinia sorghi]|uniref:OTU domain-containing protein n=1 Tax=Puccinia sorghi TaxID=27349 RepID=A0A0L6V241_9BASI|nr:hypothetical protein VP01_3001g1 [Puccinia sorghi]
MGVGAPIPVAEKLIWELSGNFIPHLDVKSDGHCGFQVVSYFLERGKHDYLAVQHGKKN